MNPSTKPLSILVLLHWAWPHHNGGAEMMMKSLLRPLVERGHSIDVLEGWEPLNDSYRHDGLEIEGVRIHPYRSHEDPFPYLEKTDVFITHLQQTERAIYLAPWVKKPVVIINHNDNANTAHFMRPEYLDRAHMVHNSEWVKESLEKPYTRSHPYSIVCRPPVFTEDYKTTPGDKVTLINLNEDKGARVFWELASRLPDVQFLAVIGAHGKQIVPAEVPANVELVAHTSDMRSVYSKTCVLLMPSIYESWGRVGVEAMASGIPVIAHPTPGLKESLGEAGIFLDRDNTAAWQAQIKKLKDKRSWNPASKKALKRSAELEAIRKADLSRWTEFVENAKWHGR